MMAILYCFAVVIAHIRDVPEMHEARVEQHAAVGVDRAHRLELWHCALLRKGGDLERVHKLVIRRRRGGGKGGG